MSRLGIIPRVACVAGVHSSKELFEQLVILLFKISTYVQWTGTSVDCVIAACSNNRIYILCVQPGPRYFLKPCCDDLTHCANRRGIKLLEANPMSGVFKNIDPPPPHRPVSVYAFGTGGGHTRWVERGWGVNILEDARHCSVLYICKYFVAPMFVGTTTLPWMRARSFSRTRRT
jgi:hypothetical protein